MKRYFKLYKPYKNLVIAISEKLDGSMKLFGDPTNDKIPLVNREKFFKKAGINPDLVVRTNSVHNGAVRIVEASDKGITIARTDGFLTKEKDVLLSITVGDCLPIFFYDHKEKVIALVHCGWRELVKDILANTLKIFKEEFKSLPENILAGLGPGICGPHYEIGPEIYRQYQKRFPASFILEDGKIFWDLKKAGKGELVKLGLPEKNIELSRDCTYCLPGKYFSFRRDKPKRLEAMLVVFGRK